jgi:hypothetical protein
VTQASDWTDAQLEEHARERLGRARERLVRVRADKVAAEAVLERLCRLESDLEVEVQGWADRLGET